MRARPHLRASKLDKKSSTGLSCLPQSLTVPESALPGSCDYNPRRRCSYNNFHSSIDTTHKYAEHQLVLC